MLGIGLGITSRLRSSVFNPASLFRNGEQGWFYDLSDVSTLFQDAAGTTPVTAVGQPVGLQLDKSGRGNHRSQSVSLNRPTLRQDTNGLYYLEYDGLNDNLSTSAFAWGSDKATVVAGVRKLSDAAGAIFAEFGTSSTLNGTFGVFAPGNAGANYGFAIRGTVAGTSGIYAGYPAPESAVVSARFDTAGTGSGASAQLRARRNGANLAPFVSTTTAGNILTHQAFFGARAGTSLFFNGREYSNFAINRLLTANELAQIERYTAQRTGVTIP